MKGGIEHDTIVQAPSGIEPDMSEILERNDLTTGRRRACRDLRFLFMRRTIASLEKKKAASGSFGLLSGQVFPYEIFLGDLSQCSE